MDLHGSEEKNRFNGKHLSVDNSRSIKVPAKYQYREIKKKEDFQKVDSGMKVSKSVLEFQKASVARPNENLDEKQIK